MMERRDVRTGKFVKADYDRRGYRTGEAWWEVSGFTCSPPCVCGGFEVCLQRVERFPKGGGVSGPVWPSISCSSEAEVKVWMKKLSTFARTIKPEGEELEEKYNGDRRLGKWLEGQGFVRYNHIVWGPPKGQPI